MRDPSFQSAAASAAARASKCHARIEELRARRPFTETADNGKADLADARWRAAQAGLRLALSGRSTRSLQTLAEEPVRGKDVASSDDGSWQLAPLDLDWQIHSAYPTSTDLWSDYWALGGSYGAQELDAFMNRSLRFPTLELYIIEQAVWERSTYG